MDFTIDDLEKEFSDKDEIEKQRFQDRLDSTTLTRTKGIDSWELAELYHSVINDIYFKNKFSGIKEYAEWVGVSKATITRYCKAYEFDQIYNFDHTYYSVNKVYSLSTLEKDYSKFMEYCTDNDIAIKEANVKELIEIINGFKYGNNATRTCEVTYEKKKYLIPTKILEKYYYEDVVEDISKDNRVIIDNWVLSNRETAVIPFDGDGFDKRCILIPKQTFSFWNLSESEGINKKEVSIEYKGIYYKIALQIENEYGIISWDDKFSTILDDIKMKMLKNNNAECFLFFSKESSINYTLDVINLI